MPRVPKRVNERIVEAIQEYQNILKNAWSRDINKTNTSIIVIDMLNDVFGYDKYKEITNDYYIDETFCDAAISIEKIISVLVEIKAVGLPLKDDHIKAAVNYAANNGINYIILTNGIEWCIYYVELGRPRNKEMILHFDFLELDAEEKNDIELLYTLSKEGMAKTILPDYLKKQQAMSRYTLGAMLLSERLLELMTRDLKKIAPSHKFEQEDILEILQKEVIKREVLENNNFKNAIKEIEKANYKPNKRASSNKPIITPSKITDKTVNLSVIK